MKRLRIFDAVLFIALLLVSPLAIARRLWLAPNSDVRDGLSFAAMQRRAA